LAPARCSSERGRRRLAQHRRQQVQRLDVLVVVADRDRLRIGQRFLKLGGELVPDLQM
jgi:hypothetical protein